MGNQNVVNVACLHLHIITDMNVVGIAVRRCMDHEFYPPVRRVVRADHFEALFARFKLFHFRRDTRNDHDSRAVLFVAASACSALRKAHTAPSDQRPFCDTIGMYKATDRDCRIEILTLRSSQVTWGGGITPVARRTCAPDRAAVRRIQQ